MWRPIVGAKLEKFQQKARNNSTLQKILVLAVTQQKTWLLVTWICTQFCWFAKGFELGQHNTAPSCLSAHAFVPPVPIETCKYTLSVGTGLLQRQQQQCTETVRASHAPVWVSVSECVCAGACVRCDVRVCLKRTSRRFGRLLKSRTRIRHRRPRPLAQNCRMAYP